MSKKLILFLMLAVFGSTSLLKADVIEIGNPTASTSTYAPAYSLYNYSLSEQIYTADEMGGNDCTINSISFYWSSGGNATNEPNWQIYMKAVHGTFPSSSDYIPVTAADLVYSGTVQLPASGSAAQWVTITLNTPYQYNSSDDLLLCVNNVTGTWWSSNYFGTFTPAEQYACLYRYQDSGAFDPTASQPSCNSMNKKNAIQLDVTPAGGAVTISPATLDLGQRPNNAWMEPACLKVKNTNPAGATVSTSFLTFGEYFNVAHLNEYNMGYKEEKLIEMKPAAGKVGTVQAVFAATFSENEKDMATAVVNGEFYTAAMPDVVEFAKIIGMSATETPDFAALHHNYNLPNAIEGAKDAVYKFTIAQPKRFTANINRGHMAIYNTTQPKADNAVMEGASFNNVTLEVGTYYIVAEATSAFTLNVNITDFPALVDAPVLVSPANMATNVSLTPTLTWTLPEGTVYYRLLVNTVYNLPVATSTVVDWTTNLATSYTLPELNPSTQYFWRVDAKNADGTVVKSSTKWGFTTSVTTPYALEADDETIFEGDDVTFEWKGGSASGFEGELTVCDGTATDGYVPVYGFYCDAYLRCQMVYTAEMLEEMEGGEITSMKFHIASPASGWGSANFQVYLMEVPGTTISAFTDPSYATTVYTGSLSGTGSEMVVTFNEPYVYEGGNLLVGIDNITTGTYSSISYYGIASNGSSVQGYSYSALASITPTQRNFLPKTTFVCGDAKNTPSNRSFLGFNIYKDNVKLNNELLIEKEYTVSGLTYNMDGYSFGVTEVHSEGESAQCENVVVYVSGNGAIAGHVYDIDGTTGLVNATVTLEGEDEFGDAQTFTATTGNGGMYFAAVKAGEYDVTAYLDGFTPVTAKDVVITYATTTEQNFVLHENYNPAAAVLAEEVDQTMSKVSWSLGSMPGPGGAGDEFMFDFEDGFQGWTSIDADGDGYGWKQASTVMSGVYGHNNSADFVFSQSYDNSYGVLYPNNYLVTPQKYRIGGSSVFSMWACAQDAGYSAEHFSVEVSEDGTTFTTVSEWTIGQKTAKSGQVRNERDQSTWIEYTADLSAYSGKQMYIAVRHFNCSDQFYLDVDDCSLYNAGKGDRSLQYYTIYRQQTMVEGATAMIPEEELVPEVVSAQCNDTAWVDFSWGNVATGVYQYGVQVTYGGNHGGNREMTTLIDEGFEGGVMPEGWTSEGSNTWTVGRGDYSTSTGAASGSYNALCTHYSYLDAYLVTPTMDLSNATSGTVSFSVVNRSWAGDVDGFGVYYRVDGGAWNEIYFSTSTNSTWTQYTVDLTGFGANYQLGFLYSDNYGYGVGIDNVLVVADINEEPESPVTGITWSNMLGKNMEMTLDLAVMGNNMGDVRGAVATFTNISEEYAGLVYEAELDSTGLYTFEGFRKGNYAITVECPGFTTFEAEKAFWGDQTYNVVLEEAYNPVTNFTVSSTGWANWTAAAGNVDHYQVMMNNVAQGNTEMTGMQLDVTGLTEGQTYQAKVAVIYATGMSDWATANFTYRACDNYASEIDEVIAFTDCMDVTFSWGGGTPTPPVPPTPGEGDEFTEGFENGLPTGWTNLDADGDGYYWRRGTDYMTAPVGHNSNDCMFSNSYDNNYGALTPDNYLVSPQVLITTGSTFSFWACAQDASYAYEHYGVAVSTTTPTAGAFTTIAEWTMTAKEGPRGTRGTNAQGTWYNKSVDLSSYAGQQIYIAIRHFNCTDAFYLDVDDVQLAINGKGGNGTFSAAGMAMAGNTELRDGNWYGYDNGNANEDAIGTGGGNFWWGIMLPAGSFEGNKLSKVAAYDYMAMTGTVDIYQGGTSAPAGSSLGTANISMSGSNQYIETAFAEPITIDPTQNVWVVYYNGSGATHPAAVCANTGDANGRWVSLDGSAWEDLASYGLSYTFMVRAYIEAGGGPTPGPVGPVMTENTWALFLDGEFIECVDLETTSYAMTMTDYEEHEFSVVRVYSGFDMACPETVEFVAGGVSMPQNLNVEWTAEGTMISWNGYADTYKVYRGTTATNLVEIGETEDLFYVDATSGAYYYGVRAITDCGQSDMAVIGYDNVNELGANAAIYPNPTKGDLHIYAQGMSQITIVNTLGQVVYNQNVNADEMTLNMSQFGTGMYIINIVTENGTSTQRVNVIK